MATPKKYTKVKVVKITEVQDQTLKKLDSYQVNVAQFIRDAIAEKIKMEYKNLLPKPKKGILSILKTELLLNIKK